MTSDVISGLLSDLTLADAAEHRLERLVSALRTHFRCDAVALLKADGEHLRPVAVDGLVREALGRRFALADHPRMAAIAAAPGVIRFEPDSTLPDPYDGLVDAPGGAPLAVHECVGLALRNEGSVWGIVTLDALETGAFGSHALADLAGLAPAIEAAIRITRLELENRVLRLARTGVNPASPARGDDDILGQSDAIAQLLHELNVVADSELPVLLLGETGVGKELFAHRLHRLSRRHDKPLIHINCAALPESLAESELFGHVRGAFSGAMSDRPGRFEAADGGTLFLDEVGELPLAVQAKLLRTLQNGEIQRLGADRPRHVDVRVIAATNRSLRDLVRDGTFRADLYHRLSVYPIPIPPLRERGNDVLLLAGRFLELNRSRLGLRSLRLSSEAQEALRRYRWPGNVRELEHAISRAALKAVSRGANRKDIVTLEAELLDLDALEEPVPAITGDVEGTSALPLGPSASLQDIVAASQRDAIRQALAMNNANWAAAARQLGLDASNLHKLARRLGIKLMIAGR